MSEDCQSIIGAWTIGTDGHCISDEFGFPIGLRGFRYAVLEASCPCVYSLLGGPVKSSHCNF